MTAKFDTVEDVPRDAATACGFREIAGHPGYRINADGRVQSDILSGSKKRQRTGIWKDLKPYLHPRFGYLYVDLRTGKRRNKRVNVLVLEAFMGPRPRGTECRHLDGNRINNRLENLRWGTRSENMQDAVRHGTIKRGESQRNSKLREIDIPKIRLQIRSGLTQQHIADAYGISNSVISEINTRKAWRHI